MLSKIKINVAKAIDDLEELKKTNPSKFLMLKKQELKKGLKKTGNISPSYSQSYFRYKMFVRRHCNQEGCA